MTLLRWQLQNGIGAIVVLGICGVCCMFVWSSFLSVEDPFVKDDNDTGVHQTWMQIKTETASPKGVGDQFVKDNNGTGLHQTWIQVETEVVSPKGRIYTQPKLMNPGRADVLTVSPWLAPIIWEGTFNPKVIDDLYKPLNVTIATTVFAVGKYLRLLRRFLETAEKHYMVGFIVHYYVFTDKPSEVPYIPLGSGRSLTVVTVPKFARWQEISLRRMEFIRKTIEERIHREANFLYCLDVDMIFHNRWGAEVLGQLVAAVHPWFYNEDRRNFPYERRAASQAYIPIPEGDFYYAGAVFGGCVDEVYKVTKTCEENLDKDKVRGIEAVWQEESHLNLYFIYHKPTKLLSPEYIWDDLRSHAPEIRVIRLATVLKNNFELRQN